MKITVLVDNNTLIGRYFRAEPGLSLYIEADNQKVLFDTGYSGLFIENAQKMGINLHDLDYVVISHGHLDHSWGLVSLTKMYTEAEYEKKPYKKPCLITHPHSLNSKTKNGFGELGFMLTSEKLALNYQLHLSSSPLWLSKNTVFLGQIPRVNDFELAEDHGYTLINGNQVPDQLLDDSALACKTDKGIIVVTGCSHSGICNIVEHAKSVCADHRIRDVIGGFHLLNPDKLQLKSTVEYFKTNRVKKIHPCHCTDLHSKTELSRSVKVCQVGTGMKIEY